MENQAIQLPQTHRAWGTSSFAAVLKAELEQLKPEVLPLQQGLTHGSYVSGDDFQVMMIAAEEAGDVVRVKVGIHYHSIIAGCSCADDPTPVDELSEYCEVEVTLDKGSPAAKVVLLET